MHAAPSAMHAPPPCRWPCTSPPGQTRRGGPGGRGREPRRSGPASPSRCCRCAPTSGPPAPAARGGGLRARLRARALRVLPARHGPGPPARAGPAAGRLRGPFGFVLQRTKRRVATDATACCNAACCITRNSVLQRTQHRVATDATTFCNGEKRPGARRFGAQGPGFEPGHSHDAQSSLPVWRFE
jgi:hypothetical protein